MTPSAHASLIVFLFVEFTTLLGTDAYANFTNSVKGL